MKNHHNYKIGICFKCKQEKPVRMHHWKGYLNEYKDDVKPYCLSCDRKAHFKARQNGKCSFKSNITRKLSINSYHRRHTHKFITFTQKQTHRIFLIERIDYCEASNSITILSDFHLWR